MQLIKNSIIYLGSSIINKAIPFLLLPILTDYLTPEEYGILAIFQLMISFYSAFVGMAIQTNISKNFFNYSKQNLALLIGNSIILITISLFICTTVTFLFYLFNSTLFSVESNWVLIIPLISYMMMVNTLNLTLLRNQNKAILFGFFEITNTFINVVTTVTLVTMYNYGWYSQAMGIIVAHSVFFFISIFRLKKTGYLVLKKNSIEIKKLLNVSIPLIPHIIGGIVIALSDRFFIEKMVNLKMVGIYSVGYTFGMVIIIFTDSFIKAWSPWFYKNINNTSKKITIVKYSYLYIIATLGIAFGVSLFSKLILPYVVNERYADAGIYIYWISFGYAIHGIYKLFMPYLVHINKTYFLGISTLVAALLNLIFNYLFIKEFGTIGAAYSTVVSFTASTCLVFWFQNKHFKMPWLG